MAALAVVMALSSMASAAVHAPPWHGSVSKSWYEDLYGCATGKATKPTFSMTTGKGGLGVDSSTSKSCNTATGHPIYSDADASSEITAWVQVKIGSGSHNVTPTITSTWAGAGHISASGSCPSYTTNYTNLYSYGGYVYYDNSSSTQAFCEVYGESQQYLSAELYDATNGTYIPITWGTGCTFFFSTYCQTATGNYAENYTVTSASSYSDHVYNGTGWTYYNGSSGPYTYGYATPWTSYSSSGTQTVSPSFVYKFVGTHKYFLYVDWIQYCDATSESWPGGHAAATMNGATLGNGIDLVSVAVL